MPPGASTSGPRSETEVSEDLLTLAGPSNHCPLDALGTNRLQEARIASAWPVAATRYLVA